MTEDKTSHPEISHCFNCRAGHGAKVEHTFPMYTYQHECLHCRALLSLSTGWGSIGHMHNRDMLNVTMDMRDESVDVVITDPPYGVRKEEGWDDATYFKTYVSKWLGECLRVTKHAVVWFCADRMIPHILRDVRPEIFQRILFWDKPKGSQYAGASNNNIWYSAEPILIFTKNKEITNKYGKDCKYNYSNFIYDTVPSKTFNHPTIKPVELIARLIEHYSAPDEIVFDPFLGCFDAGTEVLTKNGWKYFDELLEDDRVCSLNPINNSIEYVKYIRHISYNYEGDMYHIKGRSVDLLVTPNHKIYAKEYHHNNFSLYTVGDFEYKAFHKLSQGIWYGNSNFDNDSFLELYGFWLGDGYVSNGRVFIKIKKSRKINYLQTLLTHLGYKYSIAYDDNDSNRYEIKIPEEYKKYFLGNAHTKRVSTSIFDLSAREISLVIKGYWNADGSSSQLYTCNKLLADDLQVLSLLSGISASIKTRDERTIKFGDRLINSNKQYEIYMLQPKQIKLRHNNIKKEFYSGMVYDVTLEKNHILYVRRNGKPVWSGNSGTTAEACIKLGRKFIGSEKDPQHFETIIKRINNLTSAEDFFGGF